MTIMDLLNYCSQTDTECCNKWECGAYPYCVKFYEMTGIYPSDAYKEIEL